MLYHRTQYSHFHGIQRRLVVERTAESFRTSCHAKQRLTGHKRSQPAAVLQQLRARLHHVEHETFDSIVHLMQGVHRVIECVVYEFWCHQFIQLFEECFHPVGL